MPLGDDSLNAGGTHSCVGVRNQRALFGGGLDPEQWGLEAANQIALLLVSGHPHTHPRATSKGITFIPGSAGQCVFKALQT